MEEIGKPGDRLEELGPPLMGREGGYSRFQLHFLRRLERVLRLRYEQGGNLNAEGVRLLDQGIYSSYCDCVDLGVGNEAQKLIRRFPVPSVERRASEA